MVADIASCRHRPRVRSNPSAVQTQSSSAIAMGASCACCACSRYCGSVPARSSKASLISSSDRTSREWLTGLPSHAQACFRPANVAVASSPSGPISECWWPIVRIRPSTSSRCMAR